VVARSESTWNVIDMGSAPAGLKWEVITLRPFAGERDEVAVADFVRRRVLWECRG